MPFKTLKITSVTLLLLVSVNAFIAGGLFILDPTGSRMGMSTSYLVHSPFKTFLVPGITLFVVNGLLNLITAVLTLKNHRYYPFLILMQGVMLAGWIIIQVLLVKDFNALHFSMLLIGVFLLTAGILLKTRYRPF